MIYTVNVFDEEYITEQNGQIELKCGFIETGKLKIIIAKADLLDMKCLNFISKEQDTIFNYHQAKEIIKEIKILRDYPEINRNALDILQKGSKSVSEHEFFYLKIKYFI